MGKKLVDMILVRIHLGELIVSIWEKGAHVAPTDAERTSKDLLNNF